MERDTINNDQITSYIRTIVPILWGSLVSYILASVTVEWFAPIADVLRSEELGLIVTGLVVSLWYALWRYLEPKLPDWLTRVVLGSAKAPSYE